MGKRELVALLSLSSWCLVIVVLLFFAVPWVCLQFVVLVFPDHTLLLFLRICDNTKISFCFIGIVYPTEKRLFFFYVFSFFIKYFITLLCLIVLLHFYSNFDYK